MNPKRDLNLETLETQVAVIGGGGAGLCAAVAAAEKGAAVTLLEKARRPGGNSALARDVFACESPTQKRCNLEVSKDELFKIHMDYSHWRVNPGIVRAFINKSGDTIRWLEEKGLTFDLSPHWPGQHLVPGHVTQGGGAELIKVLTKNSEDLGVRVLCETGARELLIDEKKGVTGVVATRKGKKFRIKAGSVIIATGGYGGNKRMLRKYYPYYSENIHNFGVPNMGDGISMAMKIGAATEGLGILHMGAGVVGVPREVWIISMEPISIWVNKRGERFMDEGVSIGFARGNPIFRQPDSLSYSILDEKIKQNIIENGLIKGLGPPSTGTAGGQKLPDIGKLLLQSAAEKERTVKISDSWDEIAGWIGAEPAALKATIDEYNSCCDKGYDDLFIKNPEYLVALRNPPYYAIRSVPRLLGTIGGIKINPHTEALDLEDKPIPGLYAAGIDTGGWETETYNLTLTGHAFGFSLNSGRIAGENAAIYVMRN